MKNVKPIVALSTCWCSHRHNDGYAMLREMAGLGFEWVELSHGVRITLVPGILKAVEEGIVKIASCHNFCPLPTGVNHAAPNLYVPSAADERERDQWFRHTKRTIDFAQQVGATKIVLHLGAVEFFWFNPARKLERLFEKNPAADWRSDRAYQKTLGRARVRLEAAMPPFWEYTKASLAAILPHAEQKGVKLGFENRERFDELPRDEDHAELVAALARPGACGYWHDAGHAAIKEAMGVIDHRAQLEKNAAHTLGFHLHDVSVDGRDHQAIGAGRIDFDMVSSFWRPEHTLVIELSPRVSADGVTASKTRVDALLAMRFPGAA